MTLKKMLAVLILALIAVPTTAGATPTNDYVTWQIWAYVHTYREKNNGDVVVWFEDGNGNLITNFPNGSGQNQCPNDPVVVIHRDHPLFERITKALLVAGLARKKVKIAYEGVDGTCYGKMVALAM